MTFRTPFPAFQTPCPAFRMPCPTSVQVRLQEFGSGIVTATFADVSAAKPPGSQLGFAWGTVAPAAKGSIRLPPNPSVWFQVPMAPAWSQVGAGPALTVPRRAPSHPEEKLYPAWAIPSTLALGPRP